MKKRIRSGRLLASCAIGLLLAASFGEIAPAQTPLARSNPIGPPPRADNKLYAFSGTWAIDHVVIGIVAKGVIPLTPKYEAIRAHLQEAARLNEPLDSNEPRCIPNGPIMGMKFSFEVFANDDRLTVLISRMYRYIDVGVPHTNPDELFDTYGGESVAHWEGDSLVVDTIGLKATDELDVGIPNSGNLHLIERWRILPSGKLEIRWTAEDPVAMTKPWSFTVTYSRRPPPNAADIIYCVPALDHTQTTNGVTGFDLTPPQGGYVPPGH